MNKWVYEVDLDTDVWRSEFYKTREEAVSKGNSEAIKDKRELFRVGIAKLCENCGVDAIKVIEDMQTAMDDAMGEVAEDYLEDVTNEHLLELEEQLSKVFCEWEKKHNYEPTFYEITDIEILKAEGDINE